MSSLSLIENSFILLTVKLWLTRSTYWILIASGQEALTTPESGDYPMSRSTLKGKDGFMLQEIVQKQQVDKLLNTAHYEYQEKLH